ncbi:MAG: class I SAM-dependent methyltransferase [Flavobacteriales bacterium]|nr:class I SAM-dependent methyltransferase [Flavobacteriales bacterium]MCB9365297.1 class I SAM-dependent methyltransferase [Flavobacteriales bacterium]
MIELPQIETQKIAIKLRPNAEVLVKKRHPWVFDESITKQNNEGKAGDLAIVFDNRKNKFLAAGLYDPNSPIRIKILQANQPFTFNKEWLTKRIEAAYNKRLPLLATETNSYRLLYGENDGLPSLIADVYDNVLVVKLYSQIWFPYLNDIFPTLLEISKTKTLVLRMSRNVQKEGNQYSLKDGQIIHGTLENEVIIFTEHGVKFSANVIHGHKTGYFLDHRNNRKRVGELAKNKTVLDVFSYAGGFSVHALAGGAKEVTSLDISAPALKIAEENAQLNPHIGKHLTIVGDAFDELEELAYQNKKYDIVVIDPPSFAKSKLEVDGAIKSYQRLTLLGLKLVNKEGILVLASCSSRVSSDEFFELVETTLQTENANYKVLDKTLHDTDHPIGFKEGAYLKCIYIQIK